MSEYMSEFGCIREFVGEFASFLQQKVNGVSFEVSFGDTGRVS